MAKDKRWEIIEGDSIDILKKMPSESVQTCITSPPYWGLRDYETDNQIGLEATPEEYVKKLVNIFREVRRVLKDDGTVWLNLGDTYSSSKTSGVKAKNLIGIPWRVAFALQADGWYLRSDIIWAKPNPMPEAVKDRPTKAHEYIFLLTKSPRYYYDIDSIREEYTTLKEVQARSSQYNKGDKYKARPDMNSSKRSRLSYYKHNGKNKRTIWTVSPQPFKGAHFAVFPPKLIEPCVLAGSPVEGTVLDPFSGSGTTGVVALKHGRKYIGLEINKDYAELSRQRIKESLKT